jgi:ectoine hydroxylase-related dioxygenase (phytanoyl-CoA dioxygenase family)
MERPPTLPDDAELHPWNRGFTWAIPSGPGVELDAEQRGRFDADGFLVLPAVIGDALLSRLVEELDAFQAEVAEQLARRENQRMLISERGAITFAVHPVLRSAAARDVAKHPVLVGLARDLLGPDVNFYWDQAVYKQPERPRRFPWHQDSGYAFVQPQHYLTCWIALTDATVDNGCPQVLPGAHRAGTLLHRWVDPLGLECFETTSGAVPAEVPAGGVVVFSSLTPHFTGPNTTTSVRKAYIAQYAPVGVKILSGDPSRGAPTGEAAAEDPDRQFPVLRGGERV